MPTVAGHGFHKREAEEWSLPVVHYSGILSTMKRNSSDAIHRALANRIKQERERRQWSLAELSQRSAVSTAMLSKIERGESSPTAALLGRLSGAFQLTLSELFARPDLPLGQLARRNEQACWQDPRSGFVRRSLTPEPTRSPLQLVWGELPPGSHVSYSASAFTFIDQQIVVIKGRLTFQQGARTYELKEGDCLHLGPPENCTFSNLGSKPCHYLVAVVRTRNPPHSP